MRSNTTIAGHFLKNILYILIPIVQYCVPVQTVLQNVQNVDTHTQG